MINSNSLKLCLLFLTLTMVQPIFAEEKHPINTADSGWKIIDQMPAECEETNEKFEQVNLLKCQDQDSDIKILPLFKTRSLKVDAVPAPVEEADAPWRKWKLKIDNAQEGLVFALKMQAYVYKGFISKDENRDLDFIAQNNNQRYWCHTPWLNVGVSGRELVHGLTKEFPLKPAPGYAELKGVQGMSWGTAYFNSYACQDYTEIYMNGDQEKNPAEIAQKKSFKFQDGYASFKLLFNNGKSSFFDEAYKWNVHAAGNRFFNKSRFMQQMSHLQMDIAIKDKALWGFGAKSEVQYWVMLTYAYDPAFNIDNNLNGLTEEEKEVLSSLPDGLKKMRPVGIQYGLDAGDTIVFEGAHNNHALEKENCDSKKEFCLDYLPPEKTRLNGPADNPVSSCLGCHATAGTDVPVAPGFTTNVDFKAMMHDFEKKGNNGEQSYFDFNQQLKLSVDYIKAMQETGKQEKKKDE